MKYLVNILKGMYSFDYLVTNQFMFMWFMTEHTSHTLGKVAHFDMAAEVEKCD